MLGLNNCLPDVRTTAVAQSGRLQTLRPVRARLSLRAKQRVRRKKRT